MKAVAIVMESHPRGRMWRLCRPPAEGDEPISDRHVIREGFDFLCCEGQHEGEPEVAFITQDHETAWEWLAEGAEQ